MHISLALLTTQCIITLMEYICEIEIKITLLPKIILYRSNQSNINRR